MVVPAAKPTEGTWSMEMPLTPGTSAVGVRTHASLRFVGAGLHADVIDISSNDGVVQLSSVWLSRQAPHARTRADAIPFELTNHGDGVVFIEWSTRPHGRLYLVNDDGSRERVRQNRLMCDDLFVEIEQPLQPRASIAVAEDMNGLFLAPGRYLFEIRYSQWRLKDHTEPPLVYEVFRAQYRFEIR